MVFTRQAKLVRILRHKNNLTQNSFAETIGLPADNAGAQFVSNMEREVAGIPLERLVYFKLLGAHKSDLKSAIIGDFREYVEGFLD